MSNPICNKCDSPLSLKIMRIIEGDCWNCNASMKVAIMYSPDDNIKDSSHPGPELFDNEDIEFARSKGALIKPNHSRTIDETYLSNTCGSCNAFIGGHYLFDYFCQAAEGEAKSSDYEIGYHCENCYLEDEEKAYKEKYGDE